MKKDPYVLEDGTLKNKLGITDYNELNKAEADIGFAKLIDIDSTYLRDFDAELLRSLHKHIFEDIFDWAGEYRTIPLYKEEIVIPGLSLEYEEPGIIKESLDEKLKTLNNTKWKEKSIKEISLEFTKKLAKIWRVHPFRDGNTRATLAFADLYARMHGFPFDMGYLTKNLNREMDENGKIIRYSIRDKFVLAALDDEDYPEPEHLAKMFEIAIKRGALPKVNSEIKDSKANEGRE